MLNTALGLPGALSQLEPGAHVYSVLHADIDECTANSEICDTNAVCTNTPGGFTCIGKAGYTTYIVREPGGSIGTNFGSKAHSNF